MNLKIAKKTSALDNAIDEALAQLSTVTVDSDEYSDMLTQITRLHKLKEQPASKRVSPDTLVLVAGNLAGIVLILGYERAHVVTSKALSFVLKAK